MTTLRMSSYSLIILSVFLLIIQTCSYATAFAPVGNAISIHQRNQIQTTVLFSTNEDDVPSSLEEKMKSWEASEDEIKAATLGGVVPGRSDAFDVGLYVAFRLMVLSGIFFAIFPFIMSNIDTSSVGPPPTV